MFNFLFNKKSIKFISFIFVLLTTISVMNQYSETTITGGNIANQTWTPAGSPYIIQGDITVPNGAYLRIEPGVVIKFYPSDAMATGLDTSRVEFTIRGELIADASSGDPIIFTSQQTTPAVRDWYGIVLDSNATNVIIKNADIGYAYIGVNVYSNKGIFVYENLYIHDCSYNIRFNDTNLPYITNFTLTSPSTTNDPEVHFNLTGDDISTNIVGYMITENSIKPAASDPRWNSLTLTSYTLPNTPGTYNIYAWIKDEAGNVSNQYTPITVNYNIPLVKNIAAGAYHSVAIKDGKVLAWGLNNYGQCTVPVELDDDIVIDIAAGRDFTVALKDDGTVVAWGNNNYGQCNVPAGLMNVIKISAGFYHAAALLNDGTIICWGLNEDGQINVPGSVIDVKDISCGARHTIALRNDGTVIAWGYNYYGQCNIPAGLFNVNKISAGGLHTIALLNDGTVVCWGRNDYNQCDVPAGLTDVVSIDAGGSATYAVKNDGTVIAWGFNGNGETNVPTGIINAVDVSAGKERNSHVLVLKSDGKITSWGYNEFGQCNVSSIINGDRYKAISAGSWISAAVREDGTLTCWGWNEVGQCDIPEGLSNVKSISVGGVPNLDTNKNYAFVVALKEDGTVICWGANYIGQCNVPTGLANVIEISVGAGHTAALKEDGTVICWGYNVNGECNVPTGLTNVKSVSAGLSHTVALKEDGTVICWGYNNHGECSVPTGLTNVKAISAGGHHTMALKEDGTVVCWGDNSLGQCNVPAGLTNIKTISAGYCHTVALKEDGTVVAWGWNEYGQCNVPAGLTNIIAISAGDYYTLALKENGSIIGWGNNYFGESLGSKEFENIKTVCFSKETAAITTYDPDYPFFSIMFLKNDGNIICWGENGNGECNVPTGLTNIKSISAGEHHKIALKDDGTVVCWGDNSNGQCNVPSGLTDVVSVTAGLDHTVVLKSDGTVVAWGYNNHGECNVPIGLANVKEISAGSYYTMALKNDGTVVAWGYNNYGQCNVPAGLINVKSISAGGYHAVALKEDGTIVCWGYNSSGECNVPAGLIDVIVISAGCQHTVALKTDGTLVCWGLNASKQCNVPAGLIDVNKIFTGGWYTLALKEYGNLIIWGGEQLMDVTNPGDTYNLEFKFPEINSTYLTQYIGYTLDIQDNYDYGIDINYSGNFTGINKTNFILNREVDGFTATLDAPLTYDGLYFSHWLVDGVSQGSEVSSITVTIDDINPTRIAKAVYSETPPADTTPPTAPTGLSGTSITRNSIKLSWNASTDNVGVTGYNIYRNGTLVGTTTTLTYTDNGLSPATAYTYTVRAFDAAGNLSSESNAITITTINVPTVMTDSATMITGTSAVLNGQAIPNGSAAYGWFRFATANPYTPNDTFGTRVPASGGSSLGSGTSSVPYSYLITGLFPGVTYYYCAIVQNSVGTSFGSIMSFTTIEASPPTVPTGLTATNITETSVDLSWNASTDNVGVTGYNIYRDGVLVGTTSGLTYTDNGLSPATAYSYTVQAFDAAGNLSAKSSALTVTTIDVIAPSAPTGLSGTSITRNSIKLSWNASTDNVGVTGYNIYRNGTLVGTTTTLTYTDSGLTPATNYTYTVRAFDAAGNLSSESNAITITTINVPNVMTDGATMITGTSAVLNGQAIPNGSAAYGWFRYALTNPGTGNDTFGARVPASGGSSLGSGTSSVPYSYLITGLAPGVTYYYCAIVQNSVGMSYGPIMTFTTIEATPPTVPTGLTATNITETSVDLSWNASTDNVGVTGYNIYRNGTLVGNTTNLNYSDSGLTPATAYSYTVRAYDAAGNLSASSTALVVTTLADTTAPTAPTGLTAGTITETSITISWSASTDNIGVIGYNVYRNGTLLGNTASLNYTNSGLAPTTAYSYTVRAYDATGNISADSNAVTITTIDVTPPTAPSNLTVTNITETGVVLSWTASTDNVAVTGYNIYRNGVLINSTTNLTYSDTGLIASTSYAYIVKAFDAAGNISADSNVVTITTIDVTPPTAPSNLTATNISETSVDLSWTASTDNVALTDYNIYRNGTFVGTTTTLTYSDTGLIASTSYTYTVRAFDAAGNVSADSNSVTITTIDITPPTIPIGLTANNITETSVDLSWIASTDNVSVTGYYILRNGVIINNTLRNGVIINNTTTTNYTDTGLTTSTSYTYTVQAFDTTGNISAKSTPLTITTIDSTAPSVPTDLTASNITETSADLTWNASADNIGVTGYNILRDGIIINTSATNSYSDSGLIPSTTYTYTVQAFDSAGNISSNSNAVTITTIDLTPPTAPTVLTATNITETSVDLSWNASTDNVGVTGYNIYRNGVLIGTTSTLTYSDAGLTPSTSYTYTVRAFDTAGNISADSNSVTITTIDITPPTIPIGLTANNITETSVDLSWIASTDNISVTGYYILRNGVIINNTTTNNYTDASLSASTSYTYTVQAFDAAGNISNNSNAVTITTIDLTPPTAPMVLTATNITETSVDLSWNASTDNVGVTGYNIYRNSALVGTTTAITYSDTVLTSSTSYTYTVRAFDTAENVSADSNAVTITTIDITPPSAPTGLTASNITETGVDLTWAASTDNVVVTGYNIYKNGTLVGTITALSYADTGLITSTSYTYTVRAFDAAGNVSADSNAVTITTIDITPPSAPINLTVNNITETSVDLSWTASTDNVGVTGYNIYRNDTLIGTTTTLTYSDAGLIASSSYTYTVRAFDTAGNLSIASNAVKVNTTDTIPPTEPTNLEAGNITMTSIELSWTASTDNVGVAGYYIFRNGSQVANVTITNYTDINLNSGQDFTYTLRAFDAAGNISADSTSITASTLIDNRRPAAPTNLVASNITVSSVELSWTASTDNSGVIAGYYVYRNGTQIAIVTSGTSYVVTGLSSSRRYTFYVQAFDYGGNTSSSSNSVRITTLADTMPPSAPSNLQAGNITEASVVLTWDAAIDNGTLRGYYIYRNGTRIASVSGTTLTYTNNNLDPATTYTYTVRAYDSARNVSPDSNAVTITTLVDNIPPTAPANLRVLFQWRNMLFLAWDPSTDNSGIERYNIFQDGVNIGSATNTIYVVRGLTSGRTYNFIVNAVDSSGNISPDSNILPVSIP